MLRPLFTLTSLQPPELSLTRPSWLGLPSSNIMFLVCLVIYYLSVSGLTYDIINSPPAFGVELDQNGNGRPVAIMQWQVMTRSLRCDSLNKRTSLKVNQQYLVEGFTAGFMMVLAGSGMMILDKTNHIQSTK